MSILSKLKQAFVPVNQPTNFPRLYFIPETTLLQATRHASNDPLYHQPQPTRIIAPHEHETAYRKYARIRTEVIRKACAATWTAIKAFGRATVRWLARWVVLPLSIACTFWIDVAGPAELPL